ncbi:MAG: SAM-dependent methyltransferase [Oceanicoccus sp.]|jgi:SAM-dependent methyltransferase
MFEQVKCPLCEHNQHSVYHQDDNRRSKRTYLLCHECHLVFVPAEFYLSSAQEKAEYDQHDNNVQDEGYKQFLNRLWQPLKSRLLAQQTVLDFGCGPGPLLANMMQHDGMTVSVYDHFYQPDKSVLKAGYYDAITSTEVIEHLHKPKEVFEKWLSMLKPKGLLGLMTKRVTDQAAFANWHYKNDLTHVCFFSEACFAWLADEYELTYTLDANDVIIFQAS